MGKIIFFTGGSRSGKSQFAEEYIYENKYKNKIYFATAIAFDEEMKDRIRKHVQRRGDTWKTVEGYKNLISLVENHIDNTNVILFDCISNCVSNLMIMDREIDWDNITPNIVNQIEDEIEDEIIQFLAYIKGKNCDCVFVTNEVGSGLVPATPLGRHFTDICGRINQLVAKNSDEAYLAVSGIKVKIK